MVRNPRYTFELEEIVRRYLQECVKTGSKVCVEDCNQHIKANGHGDGLGKGQFNYLRVRFRNGELGYVLSPFYDIVSTFIPALCILPSSRANTLHHILLSLPTACISDTQPFGRDEVPEIPTIERLLSLLVCLILQLFNRRNMPSQIFLNLIRPVPR